MIQTQGPGGQQQMNVDISQTTAMKCEKCGNNTFKQTMMLRKLSAIVSPNGKETIIPVGVFACEACGHINKEFQEAVIKSA